MECAKWDEEGLLYMSGELTAENKVEFEKHYSSCDICKNEMKTYRREKESFFTAEFLEVATSAALDRRIKDACMKIPRPAMVSAGFFAYARKGVLPVLFLMLGFTGGAYVAFNYQNAHDLRVAQPGANQADAVAQQAATQNVSSGADEVLADASQAAGDSLNNDSVAARSQAAYDARRRGDLGRQGVIPVDVQNK